LHLLDFDVVLQLQRRLMREVAGGESAALLMCEHSPLVTVGRGGSCLHMDLPEAARNGRRLQVRWVNRGGGCWLHLPGQLAVYLHLSLDRMGLTLGGYVDRLQRALTRLVMEEGLMETEWQPSRILWTGQRPLACIGASVREGITGFGLILNVNPNLELYRRVRTGDRHPPMTSLARECRKPIRPSRIRERLLEHLARELGFGQTHWFSEHSRLAQEAIRHAVAATR
jgi:lipoyl(octanoyl) transferase